MRDKFLLLVEREFPIIKKIRSSNIIILLSFIIIYFLLVISSLFFYTIQFKVLASFLNILSYFVLFVLLIFVLPWFYYNYREKVKLDIKRILFNNLKKLLIFVINFLIIFSIPTILLFLYVIFFTIKLTTAINTYSIQDLAIAFSLYPGLIILAFLTSLTIIYLVVFVPLIIEKYKNYDFDTCLIKSLKESLIKFFNFKTWVLMLSLFFLLWIVSNTNNKITFLAINFIFYTFFLPFVIFSFYYYFEKNVVDNKKTLLATILFEILVILIAYDKIETYKLIVLIMAFLFTLPFKYLNLIVVFSSLIFILSNL